ncbi:ABC-type glutathione transport system ATPase component [Mycobacterium frederiksbergense]|uniref:ABC-type glutathione transport system ATPase component n=1 Tax=Mycolicibacterium frederiksbergense TaxID=117567 RepID=A0ABT6L793_9MYCO|nr:ATP-binding cassette domain-containing protein [Mycolicibacterium frederiksbergense]MDH6198817.1 ABC-type glutathione transport system ATPase component [Mycolicibacterium frederiksbergense]
MTEGAEPQALIEVTDVSRIFSRRGVDTRAVDSVSCRMTAGRDLGIVGESGSGKTTLARIIMGLETATAGTVRVLGEDLTRPARRQRERLRRARLVQMVYQDPYGSLDPRSTVRACLDEVLRLHPPADGTSRSDRISNLAELVGLSTAQLDRTPRELSGGQCQRVAIARALAVEPRIIVLDEAVAALDISIQAQILNLLADLRDELGTAYLLISHDLGVVRQLTDDVVVMHRGRIVESGSTEQVLSTPRQAYTRRLKASIPSERWREPGVLELLGAGD